MNKDIIHNVQVCKDNRGSLLVEGIAPQPKQKKAIGHFKTDSAVASAPPAAEKRSLKGPLEGSKKIYRNSWACGL